ncbi:unnamed protein product [Brachionus calyciflorus]|uniref:Reverse transcriptase RNase H-like domain-containing protein n=1 Tax=Brachionus calyciflorus TaxID=104777 RepID=A0A814CJ28_9BILA|nr:unnamed protein product [Brachionus calyciflorus]
MQVVQTRKGKENSTSERELLAIVWAVKHFYAYIFGQNFEIYTDNKPLSTLVRAKEPTGRLYRLLLKLHEFYFEILSNPGSLNFTTDQLSRPPVHQDLSQTLEFKANIDWESEAKSNYTGETSKEFLRDEIVNRYCQLNGTPAALIKYEILSRRHSKNIVTRIKLKSLERQLTIHSAMALVLPFVTKARSKKPCLKFVEKKKADSINSEVINLEENELINFDANSDEKKHPRPENSVQINAGNRSKIVGLDDTFKSLMDEILPSREKDKKQIDSINESRLNRALNESDTRESDTESELVI